MVKQNNNPSISNGSPIALSVLSSFSQAVRNYLMEQVVHLMGSHHSEASFKVLPQFPQQMVKNEHVLVFMLYGMQQNLNSGSDPSLERGSKRVVDGKEVWTMKLPPLDLVVNYSLTALSMDSSLEADLLNLAMISLLEKPMFEDREFLNGFDEKAIQSLPNPDLWNSVSLRMHVPEFSSSLETLIWKGVALNYRPSVFYKANISLQSTKEFAEIPVVKTVKIKTRN